jgi:hypothetical protein
MKWERREPGRGKRIHRLSENVIDESRMFWVDTLPKRAYTWVECRPAEAKKILASCSGPPIMWRLFIPGRLVLNLNMCIVLVQELKGPSYLQSTARGEIGLAARMHDYKSSLDCRGKRLGGFDSRVAEVSSGNAALNSDNLGDRLIYRTQGSKAA